MKATTKTTQEKPSSSPVGFRAEPKALHTTILISSDALKERLNMR